MWRNRRRTLITAASLFFAVFFALLMRSLQLGAYDAIFSNAIESYSGHLQLQHRDYFEDPSPDNSFELDQGILNRIRSDGNVVAMVPRLEAYALAAAGSRTQAVMVLGIEPAGEEEVSGIRSKLVKFKLTEEAIHALMEDTLPSRTRGLLEVYAGESWSSVGRLMQDLAIDRKDSAASLRVLRRHASFRNGTIDSGDLHSAVVGNGLAEYLKAGIGDTLVLAGQGYQGSTAAGLYRIAGIVRQPAPEIDSRMVYLPLEAAGELFAAPGRATSAVIRIRYDDDKNMLETALRLASVIPEPLAIRTWHELNALILNQMEADNKSGAIMVGILYLVIAFGVFGTVLMMLAERRREFGMLVSVGMRKTKLAKVFALEMLMIGFLGIAAGVVASLPLVFYGHYHPIRFTGNLARMYEEYGFEPVMPTLLPDTYYLWQVAVVLVVLTIAIGFSLRKIFRLNVITALRA